jgi:plasmid stabilization system protein ParE
MQRLIAFPLSGKPRTDIARGLRSQTAGKHKVFYGVTEETISIRRVIHARRDVAEDDIP